MRRRLKVWFVLSVLFPLALLAACGDPVVPPPDPLDFGTAPSILRGRWEGVGVSGHYRAAAFGLNGALFGAGTRKGYTVWETADGAVRYVLAAPITHGTSTYIVPVLAQGGLELGTQREDVVGITQGQPALVGQLEVAAALAEQPASQPFFQQFDLPRQGLRGCV